MRRKKSNRIEVRKKQGTDGGDPHGEVAGAIANEEGRQHTSDFSKHALMGDFPDLDIFFTLKRSYALHHYNIASAWLSVVVIPRVSSIESVTHLTKTDFLGKTFLYSQ